MRIAVASDHGGFSLKSEVIQFLEKRGIETLDLGTSNNDSVDYPDFAIKVAELVSQAQVDAGILMCGTGIGMSIVANKFKGVRSAVVSDPYSAQMAKGHNDANVLCIGGRVVEPQKARELVAAWLTAKFEGGRHSKRLEKIKRIEDKNMR